MEQCPNQSSKPNPIPKFDLYGNLASYWGNNNGAQGIADISNMSYKYLINDRLIPEYERKFFESTHEYIRTKNGKIKKVGIYNAKKIRADFVKNTLKPVKGISGRILYHAPRATALMAGLLEAKNLNRQSRASDILQSSLKVLATGILVGVSSPIGAAILGAGVSAAIDYAFTRPEVQSLLDYYGMNDTTIDEFLDSNSNLNEFLDNISDLFSDIFDESSDDSIGSAIDKAIDNQDDNLTEEQLPHECDLPSEWNKQPRSNKAHGYDPLILNLDGKGIQTIAPSSVSARFDHNADGIATATGWTAAGNGILALDLDKNGKIDSGKEIFGNHSVLSNGAAAAHGYAALAELDSNTDGKIDALDKAFNELRVWIDANSDGISQVSELHTLMSLDIQSLNLEHQENSKDLGNGNRLTHIGSYTKTDGTTGEMGDVEFTANRLYSRYTDTVELTPEQLKAPNLQGLGHLRDLRSITLN